MKPKPKCRDCFGRGYLTVVLGDDRKRVPCVCIQKQITRERIKDRDARNAIAKARYIRRRAEAEEKEK